jgi:hypothetical protein
VLNPSLDMLAIILARSKGDSPVKVVVPSLIRDGFSVLQYAGNKVNFYVSQY